MDELKPCPFCGGKAFVYRIFASLFRNSPTDFSVLCEDCRAGVRRYFPTEEEAIEAWNRRAENGELEFTRKFIHEQGLDFALMSAWNRRSKDV